MQTGSGDSNRYQASCSSDSACRRSNRGNEHTDRRLTGSENVWSIANITTYRSI